MSLTIALIDTAFSLPAGLAQYNIAGRKWNVARPGFDPLKPGAGNDDIVGTDLGNQAHGNTVLGFLHQKIKDLAEPAVVHLIRVADDAGAVTRISLVKALELALQLNADIASVSLIAEDDATTDVGREEILKKNILKKKLVLCSTLVNSSNFEKLNIVKFPAERFPQVVCGVISSKLLQTWRPDFLFDKKIQVLANEADVEIVDPAAPGGVRPEKLKCSHLTAMAAGTLAVKFADLMATEKDQYKRRNWKQALKMLSISKFSPAKIKASGLDQWFKP